MKNPSDKYGQGCLKRKIPKLNLKVLRLPLVVELIQKPLSSSPLYMLNKSIGNFFCFPIKTLIGGHLRKKKIRHLISQLL